MQLAEAFMGRRMNWRRARLSSMPKQSVSDEREFTERDHAALWLERREERLRAQNERTQSGRNKLSGRNLTQHGRPIEKPPA
jgi:hypothetical protein